MLPPNALLLSLLLAAMAGLGAGCDSAPSHTLTPPTVPDGSGSGEDENVPDQGMPAARDADETYDHARDRHRAGMRRAAAGEHEVPEAFARGIDELDPGTLPLWSDERTLRQAFSKIRDDRFLPATAGAPGLARRIPWLFPDDGCFARAETASGYLARNGYPAPKKIFVFGSLAARSEHAPGGEVYWWYHVAPAVRVGAEAYVMDPSVERSGPLTLRQWVQRLGAESADARVAICDSAAYDPFSACRGGSAEETRAEAEIDIPLFLEAEWQRLLDLGRDPFGLL